MIEPLALHNPRPAYSDPHLQLSRDPLRVPFDSNPLLQNLMIEDRSEPPDKLRELIKKTARLLVPEDDVEDMRERRKEAARESGSPIVQATDEDVIVAADDDFLCGETLTLWRLIREARELLKSPSG